MSQLFISGGQNIGHTCSLEGKSVLRSNKSHFFFFFLIGFSPGKGVVSSGTSASPLTSHSSLLCRAWEAFLSWPDSDTQHTWLLGCQGASLGECPPWGERAGRIGDQLFHVHVGLDPAGTPSQSTGLPRKDGLCPLGLPFPGLVGAQRRGWGMVASLPALCSGGSAGLEHRAGKIP